MLKLAMITHTDNISLIGGHLEKHSNSSKTFKKIDRNLDFLSLDKLT